jgi:WD40 repeat protein
MPAVCTKLLKYRRVAIVILLAACAFLFTAGVLMFNMDVRPRLVLDPLSFDGRRLSEIDSRKDPVAHSILTSLQLGFSPDCRWFVSFHSEPTADQPRNIVQLWNSANGKAEARWVVNDGSIVRGENFPLIQFSADGRYLALRFPNTENETIRLLDTSSWQERTLNASQCCFSPDGSRLAVVEQCGESGRQQLRIVETATGAEVAFVAGCAGCAHSARSSRRKAVAFWHLAYSPDGRTLTYATYLPPTSSKSRPLRLHKKAKVSVVLWDTQTGRRRQAIAVARSYLTRVAPNGKLVASLSGTFSKRSCKLWDTETGRALGELTAESLGRLDAIEFAPDSSMLVAVRHHPRGASFPLGMPIDVIAAWDVKSQRLLALHDAQRLVPGGRAVDCYFNMNNSSLPRYAVRQYVLGPSRIVEVATGREGLALPEESHESSVSNCWCSISPDQRLLAHAQYGRRSPSKFSEWFAKLIPGVTLPRGKYEYWIRCWDMLTGSEYPPILGWRGEPVFAPDSRTLATLCDDGTIKLWDMPPHKPLGLILAWSCVPAALVLLFAWWRGRRKAPTSTLKSDSA